MTFKSLEMRKLGPGNLRAIEIGVTSRCNFRCSYCGAYDLLERKILSVEDVARVIDSLPDLERVKLSGGEVLLEFDICVGIIEYCTAHGISTQINSNGTLLNDEKFNRLEAAGLDVLHFSLNHTDAARHAEFYKVTEKMFPKIVYAVERAVASPTIDAVVETILFNETEKTMADVHRFAADLGVAKHEIQMEIPSLHQGYENTLDHDRICDSIVELVQARRPETTMFFSCLSAYFRPGSAHWARLQPLFQDPGVIYASCIEGKAQLHLHSNGDVMICELGNPDVIGNVFDTDMLAIYENSPRLQAFVRSKHEDQTFSCFRHFDFPGQTEAQKKTGLTALPMPSVRK
ncbi:radical SAM protein [Actinokineospora auranticolor]|uniref:MoaA/NifB/PqqE/SkfB family radical SAM enzyme n=1 Tax=Actinokineospora auranticolor TaxID=155976 RepID=A0A2S6H158_9PSEU|nr:radical SAM protein [Actinokineospora auranticolor]PPK71203.1 MoaA/NifB/PqqE/SkfB family radical SAM enzyme [Actinokineospora auranticolor]